MRRNKAKPPIKLPFWKKDGDLWFADPADLQNAIVSSGLPIETIQKRMGVGYGHIQEVLDGKRIDGWAVTHIEWGISPEKSAPITPSVPHSSGPSKQN